MSQSQKNLKKIKHLRASKTNRVQNWNFEHFKRFRTPGINEIVLTEHSSR